MNADTGNSPDRAGAGGIVGIRAEYIWPHPDNPRKELGDLGELAESIRKGGLMQNLTVIPGHWDGNQEWHEDAYTLLIGHRRHAAAKLAGVGTLPCVVRKGLDRKAQLAIMLEENMQRADLTYYEQAESFQLMLDLGDTEEQIAEKTGFSRSTVRRRLNIAKLDQGILREKESSRSFQLSLKDLGSLEKIKDIKRRNKILEEASSSSDLQWRIEREAEEEKQEENRKKFAALFREMGIPKAPESAKNERWANKWDILGTWGLEKEPPACMEKPEGGDIQWTEYWGGEIALIKPAEPKQEAPSEQETREREIKEAKKELKQREEGLKGDVKKFIRGIIAGEVSPIKEDVGLWQSLARALMESEASLYESNLSRLYSGMMPYEWEKEDPEGYAKFLEQREGLSTLHEAIAQLGGAMYYEIHTYAAGYDAQKAGKLAHTVGFLGKYGFSLTEEQQLLLNGTHPLYRGKEAQG